MKKRVELIKLTTEHGGWGAQFEQGKDGLINVDNDDLKTSLMFRITAAQERQAVALEAQAKAEQRSVELHELHLKPKHELELANQALKNSNVLLQDALTKAYRERDDQKKRALELVARSTHLYRQIAALKGVITKMKRAR